MRLFVHQLLKELSLSFHALIVSYTQVLFSKNKWLGVAIFSLTLIFPNIALSGLLSVFIAYVFLRIFHFDIQLLKSGFYTFNPLLIGLGIGAYYQISTEVVILIILASIFTIIVQTIIVSVFAQMQLQALTLPFVFVFMIIHIVSLNASIFDVFEQKIFVLNHYYELHPHLWNVSLWLRDHLPVSIQVFFETWGSIFFLTDVLTGLLLFICILMYSRISAVLSILAFFSAYTIIQLFNLHQSINVLYSGFNFIIMAIAIGGIYAVPSIASYITVIIASALSVFVTIFLNELFAVFQLSSYSLSFILMTNFLYHFIRNYGYRYFKLPLFQEWKPETNLYTFDTTRQRSEIYRQTHTLILPFWGKWKVWQDYNGQYTHLGEYRYALDFVIEESGQTFQQTGQKLNDYYCYDQLIVAPASGIIAKILDYVEDNMPGHVNTQQNWGNSVVIKHSEYIYTQLSHLKKGSILVTEGQYVQMGQPIGRVGNSGRSPQPHLHYQVQQVPQIGAKPVSYPFVRYLLHTEDQTILMKNSIPAEHEIVENITIDRAIKQAFAFEPGTDFMIYDEQANKKFRISIHTDQYNFKYLYCYETRSVLYSVHETFYHYFTYYSGSKKSPLYTLYLACPSIEFADLIQLTIHDYIPAQYLISPIVLFFYDFVSPFMRHHSCSYTALIIRHGNGNITIQSTIRGFQKIHSKFKSYKINIKNQQLQDIINTSSNTKLSFIW